MAKTIATILGVVFILIGLIGFAVPRLMGAHFSTAHNIIHLASGATALYLGLKGSLSAARTFGLVFGGVYLLLGLAGFLLGTGGDRMLHLMPGTLEFGTMDHIIHVLMGGIFLVGGLMTGSNATSD